ncbi:beta-ketoacyl-[acyl-carrier-protein] synthase family protein [Desulfopila sp. IMCC35008]|uniref:beta-ketoacyl-[acyl-carrier-protein] synthase family protein n=1 Tax=Desulfopila sp. IMCC35008 TaxID=2653858 RepID=UPI0013D70C3B|nr:beta-ketoacyl-[acyl-carrier-protein] synthase family protein [Desulfopila sp. IMCC35008]
MAGQVPSVAVTGYGCIAALGNNCETLLDNLRDGVVNNTQLSSEFFPEPFSAPCFQAQIGNAGYRLQALSARLTGLQLNRTLQLAFTAIDEALWKAGLSIDELAGKRVGVALGTTVGCTFHNEPYYIDWKKGLDPDKGPLATYFRSNLAECVQGGLGLDGPRAVITNACASGADAIGLARSWLEKGLCDIALAGGVDELSRIACHGFKSLMLVSEESCRPFDKDRKGLNLGEGAGIIVLERYDSAIAARRSVHGWIRGYGIAGDGYHPTAPHPEGRGLQRATHLALADSGVTVADISMINAHGTGTPTNDKAETTAISNAGFKIDSVPVVSTKGATGHTLGAAGAIEAVLTLLSLNRGELYGSPGCVTPDPDFPLTPLRQGERVKLTGRIGISQSLAFGGSNAVLVIEGGH